MNNIVVTIIVLLVLALVGGGVYYFYVTEIQVDPLKLKEKVEAGADAPATTTPTGVQPTQVSPSGITWQITPREAGDDGIPYTGVVLVNNGTKHDLGTFPGSCSEIAGSAWSLVEDELTGVICVWIGGGSEIGVFNVDGKHVVKQGILKNETAEGGGTRGDYKVLLTL